MLRNLTKSKVIQRSYCPRALVVYTVNTAPSGFSEFGKGKQPFLEGADLRMNKETLTRNSVSSSFWVVFHLLP